MTEKKKKNQPVPRPLKTRDVPATCGFVWDLHGELKHEMTSMRLEMNARFKDVEARFHQVDARFHEVHARFDKVDARFDKVDARFDRMESRMEKLEAVMYRVAASVEEQNSRNRSVLDGYLHLHELQKSQDYRLGKLEETVFGKSLK